MLSKLLIVLAFGAIALFQLPRLIKEKLWKDVWVVSSFLVIGLTLALLESFGVDIPMPQLP